MNSNNSTKTDWIKLERGVIDLPRFHDPGWLKLWVALLCQAGRPGGGTGKFDGQMIELKETQLVTSREALARATRLHPSAVERLLRKMHHERWIDQKTSFQERLITLIGRPHPIEDGSPQESREWSGTPPTIPPPGTPAGALEIPARTEPPKAGASIPRGPVPHPGGYATRTGPSGRRSRSRMTIACSSAMVVHPLGLPGMRPVSSLPRLFTGPWKRAIHPRN